MQTDPDHRRFRLDCAGNAEDVLSVLVVVPSLEQQPARSLNPVHRFESKLGLIDLFVEVVRMMEEPGREELGSTRRVAVLPGLQITCNDRFEVGVAQGSGFEAVEERSEPRDRGDDHQSTFTDDSACFGKRLGPILPIWQVIERPHQEGHVERAVPDGQSSSVSEFGVERRARRGTCLGLRDVERNRIDEMDDVTESRQPRGIASWPAADIEDPRRRIREEPPSINRGSSTPLV